MALAAPRAVRISRSESAPTPGADATRGPGASRFVPNEAGTARATRLFGLYAGGLVLLYLLFVGLSLSSPVPGVRENVAAWAYLTVVTAVLGATGWVVTLGRTPSGAVLRTGELVVRERTGRLRRFPANVLADPKVVHRYGASFLGPEATEFIELRTSDGTRRTYLVGEGFFEGFRPA